ncbi:MAG: hypothetical protein DWQ08_06270, partial [Proteobacteria bacterium]
GSEPDSGSGDRLFSAAGRVDEEDVREVDLAGHLGNENGDEGSGANATGTSGRSPIERDPLVREARNLLKGLDIIRSR